MSSSNESPCGNPPIVVGVESNFSTNARSETPNSSGTPATTVGVESPPPPPATDAPPATGNDEVLDTRKLKIDVWKHFKRILKANGDIKVV
ncbi:unnamed protein product [Linum trigynum]|uniref:Uncharacterized protein n=1 Tax=Linum trigynum TaxID=586398 RepID=A0AAV2FTK6_9ROSI